VQQWISTRSQRQFALPPGNSISMPASIIFSNLSWSTPEGRPLFSNLDLSFGADRTGLVGRNGIGKTTLLKLISGERQPLSGTISINGSLGVLRQSVQIEPSGTIADFFGATEALAVVRRAEAGEATTDELASADWTLEIRIAFALDCTGLSVPSDTGLAVLSGGQRTRAALAALIFTEPDFLLLDEPTNNLDREVDAIVELTSLSATRYGGNWSRYRERKALELTAAQHDLADAEKRVTEVARSAQATAERQARRDRAGRKKAAKGDMPRIMIGGLKERSEMTNGDNARLAERRRTQALEDAACARKTIEILQPLSVTLPPTGLPANKVVLRMDAVTCGYEVNQPVIDDLSFDITGPERIAVTGPNGSGKTTLLALISGELKPWRGSVHLMTTLSMLDQHVNLLDPALSIRDNFRRVNRQADENTCRAALARFMFRADAALQAVSTLSDRQLLRAGLACVLGSAPPSLLVLDEPTNHLDIDSIAAVEAGLRAYDGALLVVSHDETFLENVGISRRLELPSRSS
jgi:ATPase subunit of ABC transporter with duplicated ATPase domains